MQRLEELMQWQRQQQGLLLRHQEEQKAQISFEQKKMLKEIGLENSDCILPHDMNEEVITNVSDPTTVVNEKTCNNAKDSHSFDDTPIQQVTKSFNELVVETLKEDENNVKTNRKEKPKKTFLRKGEGLARFRMTYNRNTKSRKENVPSKINKRQDIPIKHDNHNHTTVSNFNSISASENKSSVLKTKSPKQMNGQICGATWSHTLQKTSVFSPRREISKDFDASRMEQDELQLFELLEQHASNSSFCSTSSVVGRFLGEPMKVPSKKVSFDSSPVCSLNVPASDIQLNKSQQINIPPLDCVRNVFVGPNNNNNNNNNNRKGSNNCIDVNLRHVVSDRQCESDDYSEGTDGIYPSQTKPAKDTYKSHCNTPCVDDERNCVNNSKMKCNQICDFHKVCVGSSNNNNESEEITYNCVRGKENCVSQVKVSLPSHVMKDKLLTAGIETRLSSAEVFEDTQAWSDGSYSSEETVSGSEFIGPPPLKKETVSSESVELANSYDPVTSQKDTITFKSALLKERLIELENEIEIFKKENANLNILKKQYESDINNFNREKKAFEKTMKENSEKMQESILAERTKLAREKQVFEKYCKDIKSQPTRLEREEIKALKQQVVDLQEELIRKDQRWSATQVRTRDRMRQLNKQISQLKEENEKLKAEKAKVKKVRFFNPKTNTGSSTKVLHSINEKLGKLKMEDMETPVVIKNVVPRKKIPAKVLSQNHVDLKESDLSDSSKKGRTFSGLLSNLEEQKKDETGVLQHQKNRRNYGVCSEDNVDWDEDSCSSPTEILMENKNSPLSDALIYNSFYPIMGKEPVQEFEKNLPLISDEKKTSDFCKSLLQFDIPNKSSDDVNNIISKELNVCESIIPSSGEESNDSLKTVSQKCTENGKDIPIVHNDMVETLHPDGSREKKFSDGRQEIWYPNGNVKKLSADNLVTKMIYYNGDVKEKYLVDGTEKYYYAETKAWQTTYSDGREVLEFSDGQIECKMPNGQSQITYPNGCSLLKHVNGSEEWTLTDGTVVKKNASGIQELLFPNGQKEIHTSEHKRREYPDGTVKFIYPDGVQETRYASGRVRLKDKDGNLIMDSALR